MIILPTNILFQSNNDFELGDTIAIYGLVKSAAANESFYKTHVLHIKCVAHNDPTRLKILKCYFYDFDVNDKFDEIKSLNNVSNVN